MIENCFLFVIFSLIWSCSDIACQVGREVVQWTKVQWPKFSFKFYSHFHWVLTEGFLFSFIEFLWSLGSNFVCILSFVSGCLRPGTKAAKTKSIKNTYSFFLLLMQFILFSIQADEKKSGWLSRLMLLYLLLPAVESKWVKIWNWKSELSFWWWIKLNLMDFESLDCNQLHCYQRKHEIRGINFSESATMMSISILAFEIHIWGSLWELGLCCSTLYLKMCFIVLNVGIM